MSGSQGSTGIGRAALFVAILIAAPPTRAEPSAFDPIDVYYDGGDCGTDAIELEIYDRRAQRWVDHPRHPRIAVPSCRVEDAGGLLNELRWRCAPQAPDVQPPWRHLAVFESEEWARCAFERVLAEERARIRAAQEKRLELEAEDGALPR